MRVVATASLLPLIATGTSVGIKGVMRITVEAEMLLHWDLSARSAASLCLVD